MDKIQLGLIGYPVSHSKSPDLFQDFFLKDNFEGNYALFPIENIDNFRQWLAEQSTLAGFNVTVPHKQSIIPFLDELDASAQKMGAVNTVTIRKRGDLSVLKGYNTDYYGFLTTVNQLPQQPSDAIVLGTGGSSKAVIAVLEELKIDYVQVSRNPNSQQFNYAQLQDLDALPERLWINTTPVGMWPNLNEMVPIPQKHILPTAIAIDLIYNPEETLFLKTFAQQKAFTLNGFLMLKAQAEKAWNLFKLNHES